MKEDQAVRQYTEAHTTRLKYASILEVKNASFTALTETSFLKDDKARIAILQMIAEGKIKVIEREKSNHNGELIFHEIGHE